MNILVVGGGYVGLSQAAILSNKNYVDILDIDENRVKSLNTGIAYLEEVDLVKAIRNNKSKISAFTELKEDKRIYDFVFICTPTNFNDETKCFDTSIIEQNLHDLSQLSANSVLVIKSTVPVGFTEKMQRKFPKQSILFSPEFLREGTAYYDNLFPSRLVIGGKKKTAILLEKLIKDSIEYKDFETVFSSTAEAESIKLFSNTYLAMRVSFFNELDSFCLEKGLDSFKVIKGLSLDKRIGRGYNNPSFGYGGYCLPKDTKQLESNYKNIPQSLISSIIESNALRKKFISKQLLKQKYDIYGVYRLAMKKGSDNFRESSVIDLIKELLRNRKRVLVYEPNIEKKFLDGIEVVSLKMLLKNSQIIITNRRDEEIKKFSNKVFTRDIFNES